MSQTKEFLVRCTGSSQRTGGFSRVTLLRLFFLLESAGLDKRIKHDTGNRDGRADDAVGGEGLVEDDGARNDLHTHMPNGNP